MDYQQVVDAVEKTGLAVRGGFRPLGVEEEKEIPPHGARTGARTGAGTGGKTVILIGNAGPAMWSAFAAAVPEIQRQEADNPLDDWTREVVDALAAELQCRALYPFDGPDYLPFQRWALRTGNVFASPTGPLIHPKYGLWHAYRGALVFEGRLDLPEPPGLPSPCLTCQDKPCLAACPAGAFPAPGDYDVAACAGHLGSEDGEACMSGGCLARRACPVGTEFTYPPRHARFHMQRFLKSQAGA